MLKLLSVGLFGILATAGGFWLDTYMKQKARLADSTKVIEAKLSQVRTEMTGVPVVNDGSVSGYLVFQISSTIDASKLPSPDLDVAPYVLDAAIRASYEGAESGAQKINAKYIKNLADLTREEANKKLGAEIISVVNMEQFNFVPKAEIRGNMQLGGHK
jgi:hypothetical protein